MTPLQRILPNAYADKIISPRISSNGRPLPSARLVSNTVTTKDAESPSRVNTALLMAVGQFIDHDITLVPMIGKSNIHSSRGQITIWTYECD